MVTTGDFLDFMIDYPQVVAKEKVSGEAYLNVVQSLPAGKIILTSKGYEKVKIVESNGNAFTSKQFIYKVKEELYIWEDNVPGG